MIFSAVTLAITQPVAHRRRRLVRLIYAGELVEMDELQTTDGWAQVTGLTFYTADRVRVTTSDRRTLVVGAASTLLAADGRSIAARDLLVDDVLAGPRQKRCGDVLRVESDHGLVVAIRCCASARLIVNGILVGSQAANVLALVAAETRRRWKNGDG